MISISAIQRRITEAQRLFCEQILARDDSTRSNDLVATSQINASDDLNADRSDNDEEGSLSFVSLSETSSLYEKDADEKSEKCNNIQRDDFSTLAMITSEYLNASGMETSGSCQKAYSTNSLVSHLNKRDKNDVTFEVVVKGGKIRPEDVALLKETFSAISENLSSDVKIKDSTSGSSFSMMPNIGASLWEREINSLSRTYGFVPSQPTLTISPSRNLLEHGLNQNNAREEKQKYFDTRLFDEILNRIWDPRPSAQIECTEKDHMARPDKDTPEILRKLQTPPE